MRHPNFILFFKVLFLLRLADTLAHSPPGIRFSAGKVQISYLDVLQDILRNGTGRILRHPVLNTWRDDYAELVASIPDALPGTLTYKSVHHRFIKLKHRPSRTTKPSNDGDSNSYGSAPSKAFGHPTPPIDLFASLYLWKLLASVGFVISIGLMAPLREILNAIGYFGKIWYEFSSDVNTFIIFATERALIAFWRLLCFIDVSMGSFSIHFSELWCTLAFVVFRLLEQERIRQWKERHITSIKRKKVTSPAKFRRPYGKHAKTPLFSYDVHKKLTYLYLPEEPNQLRHMYNARHFNRVKKIGAGAFGSVSQIEHRITGKMMAMKILARENNTNDEFALEMRALARLQDGIWYPKLLSTFMDMKNFYIFMPLYCHGDLYAYIRSCGGCLNRALAKFYLAELLLAIQGLHQVGIIHRDLKPENILFSEDKHLIVADFGVAHVFDEENLDEFVEDEFPLWAEAKRLGGDEFPLLTASVDNPHSISGFAGTAFYSAPEVKLSQKYSYGVDYYSLAILYHEMVTGFVPYHVGDPMPGTCEPELILDLGRKDAHFQPVSTTDMQFLLKMLNKDPYKRPSVKQMKEDLAFETIDWEKIAKHQVPIPPLLARRKRAPISNSIERCFT